MQEEVAVSMWDQLRSISLSDVGSLASIVGLFLTISILLVVRHIKTSYLFSARVPELAKQLRRHATNLSNYLNDAPTFMAKIQEELATAEVTAHSLQRKLNGHFKRAVKELTTSIRKSNKGDLSENQLRVVYLKMVKVNEQLKDLQADLKWER